MILQLLYLITLSQHARAHSWVERVNPILNGQVQVASVGYARANVLRTAADFQDTLMTYELPPDGREPTGIYPTDTVCSSAQQYPEQSDGSPRLQVTSGQTIVLQYNENGHITKPWNNAIGKTSPGNVYVYGTNQSLPDDRLLSIHKVWTEDGMGGDRRGRLLFQGPFDDKECYQYSTATTGYSAIEAERASLFPGPGAADPAQGQNLWCKAPVTLPDLESSMMYTLYWVWDWPFEFPTYELLVYTTCIDLDVLL